MHAVSQVGGSRKASVLVNDPDGRCGGVETLRPWDDGFVQFLDLGVVRSAQADWDYLCDLREGLVALMWGREGDDGG
jgi:hypothetical protein